jgi:HlyD family secretion protein
VKAGQTLAYVDTYDVRSAAVEKVRAQIATLENAVGAREAELRRAEADEARKRTLFAGKVVPQSELDGNTMERDVARARLAEARSAVAEAKAELKTAEAARDLAVVRAPYPGQVLKISTFPGERVGAEGILALARNQTMYAVAQVYETDIRGVRVGQKAIVKSPAFASDLAGKVERIGLRVGRLDAISVDPSARKDARVVEVEIRLDDPAGVAGLCQMEVDVLIVPSA